MKIKTKLTLGFGLLFFLIFSLDLIGIKYITSLKKDTENILSANYNTLLYTRNMLFFLDQNDQKSLEKFDQNLKLQENNITESGEKESTEELRMNFEILKSDKTNTAIEKKIRNEIYNIQHVNMLAIQNKSKFAAKSADKAVFGILLAGVLCFIIALILLINLPSNIANPIKRMTASIKQIAEGNYTERIEFDNRSEFGQLAGSFNSMAGKLEEYKNSNIAKLMNEKSRIEALINNMHDPVIGLDENLNVIFINREAVKISGLDIEKTINEKAEDLALKNDLFRMLIADLLKTDKNSEAKSNPIKIFSDNKEGYFDKEILHISITPKGETSKRIIGHVIILRNVTEYKELDYAKTNFIANISHEFKTPISSIKMSLQLLDNEHIGKLNEEQKNLMDSIKDDANRLLKITGELLNMTQLESGNVQLNILKANPYELIQYAVNATKSQAEQKQIKLQIDCPSDIYEIQADSEKTAWVLINLLSNAIRYSYEDSIITIKAISKNDKIEISVKDSGQGIAPQYLDKIFARYFRIPGSNKEGTGLGLAISKEFIEAQGGSINVVSEFGIGSTFTIVLNKYD
jgi:two-component system, NtrC family, sensor histidine kinase KinB